MSVVADLQALWQYQSATASKALRPCKASKLAVQASKLFSRSLGKHHLLIACCRDSTYRLHVPFSEWLIAPGDDTRKICLQCLCSHKQQSLVPV